MSVQSFTDTQIDQAVEHLSDLANLQQAQALIERMAPQLQSIFHGALSSGGWFDSAHQSRVSQVAAEADPVKRVEDVGQLLAEETRLGMLVGVAIGYELSRVLNDQQNGVA